MALGWGSGWKECLCAVGRWEQAVEYVGKGHPIPLLHGEVGVVWKLSCPPPPAVGFGGGAALSWCRYWVPMQTLPYC